MGIRDDFYAAIQAELSSQMGIILDEMFELEDFGQDILIEEDPAEALSVIGALADAVETQHEKDAA